MKNVSLLTFTSHQVKIVSSLIHFRQQPDFNNLLDSIKKNRPVCSVVVSDFNAKCSKRYSGDKNNTADLEIEFLQQLRVTAN